VTPVDETPVDEAPAAPLSATLELARELIRRPSLTPDDAGCQTVIAARLEAAGFRVERLRHGEVDNLWARRGAHGPLLAFAGHTDVVPVGDTARWRHDPFAATVEHGTLYGRGAADMKGGVAAFVTAIERACARADRSGTPLPGSLAVLLTSDEEGPAIDGTVRVIEMLQARSEAIDYCVLGEPSSSRVLGDTMRIGRRGSLGARLTINGRQGHVAYPTLADNPVHRAAPFLNELTGIAWDEGDEHFPPTTLQVSNINAGTGATNVIPGELVIDVNLRYSPASPEHRIRERIEALVSAHGLEADIRWIDSARPFLTASGRLVELARRTIAEITGVEVEANTAGGTSDGRFIAPTGAQLVEFGPVNATIHSVDECVDVAELDSLSSIYERLIGHLLDASPPPPPGD